MIDGAIDTRVIVPPFQIEGPLNDVISQLPTGRASIDHGDFARHVWFDAGRIVAVTSDRDDEKLGAWLVMRGVVPPQTMHDALATKPGGVRLGGVLVGRSLLTADRLRHELEARSLALLWRSTLAGGALVPDGAASVPSDAHTIDGPARGLLLAAARAAEDYEPLEKLTGESQGWVCPDPDAAAGDGDGLDQTERYVLSLLKRPRTLDRLRRAALVDYPDLLRSVAALASAGLVIPCKITAAPPTTRPADGNALGDAAGAAAPTPAQDWSPLAPAAAREAQRPNIRALLDAADAAEMAADPLVGVAATRVVTTADFRRARALLDSACELAATGVQNNQVRLLLLRAHNAYPGLKVVLNLAEIELQEENLRTLALERLQKVLAQLPRCTEAWLLLARYWEARGQQEKVRASALKILAYDPANPDAQRLAAGGMAH